MLDVMDRTLFFIYETVNGIEDKDIMLVLGQPYRSSGNISFRLQGFTTVWLGLVKYGNGHAKRVSSPWITFSLNSYGNSWTRLDRNGQNLRCRRELQSKSPRPSHHSHHKKLRTDALQDRSEELDCCYVASTCCSCQGGASSSWASRCTPADICMTCEQHPHACDMA